MYCSELLRSQMLAGQDATTTQLREQGQRLYAELAASVLGEQATFPAAAELSGLDLYEYARYEHAHNATVAARLSPDLLAELASLAAVQQADYYGNLTASGRRRGDRVRAVAGRTLAARAVGEMRRFLAAGGAAAGPKLSLVVGSFEPLLSFFALAGLTGAGRASDAAFDKLPAPGAALVLELFSTDAAGLVDTAHGGDAAVADDEYTLGPPAEDALQVRLLYRDGVAPDAGLYEYPILGRSQSEAALSWVDFAAGLDEFSLPDLRTWCRICDAMTPPCLAYAKGMGGFLVGGDAGRGGRGKGLHDDDDDDERRLSPALAGVIGAVVTLGVLGIAAVAAICAGGLRLHRRGRGGGFKGPEKMASDRDLALAGDAGGQERIGSWEMAGKQVSTRFLIPAAGPAGGVAAGGPPPPAYPPSMVVGAGSATTGCSDDKTTTFGATVVRRVDTDDDGVSILSEAPVKPREAV